MGRRWRRVDRAREGWWREPPLWAWVVMVIGVVLLAVLTPLVAGRGRLPQAEVDRLNAQVTDDPAPAATTTTPPKAPPTRVVVIGDVDTGGSAEGGEDEAGWPAVLEARLPAVQMEVVSAPGAGYVAVDPQTGATFSDLIDEAPVPDAAAVIVFGSRNDGSGISDQVGEAARDDLVKIGLREPTARVVVVGPLWPTSTVPAGVRNNRDVISAAAEAVGATFVDPLADAWFVGRTGLFAADGVRATDAGHVVIADRLEPVVREALGM